MEHDLIQSPLLDEIKKYLNQIKNNEKVYLFVPYIKTKSLEKLIDGINNEIIFLQALQNYHYIHFVMKKESNYTTMKKFTSKFIL